MGLCGGHCPASDCDWHCLCVTVGCESIYRAGPAALKLFYLAVLCEVMFCIVMCVCVCVCAQCGFFKRKRKKQLQEQQEQDRQKLQEQQQQQEGGAYANVPEKVDLSNGNDAPGDTAHNS